METPAPVAYLHGCAVSRADMLQAPALTRSEKRPSQFQIAISIAGASIPYVLTRRSHCFL